MLFFRIGITQDNIDNGITVPVTPLEEEGAKNEVTAIVKDPAGNSSLEGKDDSITDLMVPGMGDPELAPQVSIADGEGKADQIDSEDLNEDGTVDVTVTLPENGGYSVGDTIVIKDNAGNTILDRELTQDDLDKGITVQAEVPADDKTLEVTATVTDPQENSAEGQDDSLVGDTTAPNAPVVDILEGNDDVIDGKDLNEDGEVDVKVYLPKDAEEGDTLTVNGKDIPITKEMVEEGSTITSVPAPAKGETLNVTATITDPAGNESKPGKDSAVGGDTTAPTAPTVNIVDEGGEAGQLDNEDLVNGQVQVTVEIADTGAEEGDIVTVTNPDGSTTNYPVTEGNLADGLTINYPKDQFPAGEDVTVSAVITDQAGNESPKGEDTTTSNLVPTPPVDPETPAELNLTVDLQDFIDATEPTEVDGVEGVWATVTGTTDAEPGSEVSIVVGKYDEEGNLVGTALPEVKATVKVDGTYEAVVNVQDLDDTDQTGDATRDAFTLGAVATVTDKVSGETATKADLDAEKASDAGLTEETNQDAVEAIQNLGLNNDMNLLYGPSETKALEGDVSFVVSKDTSYTDPLLFTNYDDTLILPNQVITQLALNNYDSKIPNDGSNPAFGSIDADLGANGNGQKTTTIDTAMGDDTLVVRRIFGNTRVYMGEGDDRFELDNQGAATATFSSDSYLYMESGDDTVKITTSGVAVPTGHMNGQIYTGSGSDTVEITNIGGSGFVDLGSGKKPQNYLTEYQDTSGLSLGNDNNTDAFDDINTLNATGIYGAVEGGTAKDIITAERLGNTSVGNARISTGKGEDEITITKDVDNSSVIDGGADDDTITVNGFVRTSDIWGGSGNDDITIDGNVVLGSKVLGGTGNDDIEIGGNVTSSTVDGGAGDDSIYIKGDVEGPAGSRSVVRAGTGADEVTSDGTVQVGSTIDMGKGDDIDKLHVKGNFVGNAYTHEGDDTVTIDGTFGFNSVSSTLDLGAGDDTVTIGNIYEQPMSNAGTRLIDGGEGYDALYFTKEGRANIGTIHNFEEIHLEGLDTTGDGQIDTNPDVRIDLKFEDLVASNGMKIFGDAGDTVDLGDNGTRPGNVEGEKMQDNIAALEGNRKYWNNVDTQTIDGVEFNVWQYEDQADKQVFIQTDITVI